MPRQRRSASRGSIHLTCFWGAVLLRRREDRAVSRSVFGGPGGPPSEVRNVSCIWLLPSPFRPGRTDRDGQAPTTYESPRRTGIAGGALQDRRRWAVEVCFRDIKTTLGLDVLRGQTPELVEKEIWWQAIAYDPVRALMLEAARTHGVEIERLSFKGTVDTLRLR